MIFFYKKIAFIRFTIFVEIFHVRMFRFAEKDYTDGALRLRVLACSENFCICCDNTNRKENVKN